MATTTVTERPIIMQPESVRAILAGRKTMTRRIIKPQPELDPFDACNDGSDTWMWRAKGTPLGGMPTTLTATFKCPYGRVGDHLWVRESFQYGGLVHGMPPRYTKATSTFYYKATDNGEWKDYWGAWRSPLHMPRWASRITLELEAIRVERVQDIIEEDAYSEGGPLDLSCDPVSRPGAAWYRELWERINGKASWAANPFVWVLSFRRV